MQVLVVVPTVTLTNWERELATWGCFKVRKFHGAKKEEALEAVRERRCEVLLTTYGTMATNADQSHLGGVLWEIIIWDEAHTMKNPRTSTSKAAWLIPCKLRFALTGTPMSNKFEELWVIFDFVSDKGVGTKSDFKAYYEKELKQVRATDCL
jgi:DNA excision repair protein ERCC-6-like 2